MIRQPEPIFSVLNEETGRKAPVSRRLVWRRFCDQDSQRSQAQRKKEEPPKRLFSLACNSNIADLNSRQAIA